VKCSKCGEPIITKKGIIPYFQASSYCPECYQKAFIEQKLAIQRVKQAKKQKKIEKEKKQ
jgi:hypothetical protein